ncbi:MAG: hypothetical protein Q9227_004871 [Pyrenula ochraceoflavens]
MEKDVLPPYSLIDKSHFYSHKRRRSRILRLVIVLTIALVAIERLKQNRPQSSVLNTSRLEEDYETCSELRQALKEPSGSRDQNARWVKDIRPILIRNATIWTGEPALGTNAEEAYAGQGWSWVSGDVLMERGLIRRVSGSISAEELPDDVEIYEAHGRPLTAGIVDMHSHAGVYGLPGLRGNQDTNELSSDITPYVRSIDGFDPLDPQIQWIKSGGVTTSLILPGSGNNMGGEAYVMKFAVGKNDSRPEISASDMLANPEGGLRWMKMACGENAKSVYGKIGRGPFSRLGEAWEFRHALEQASILVRAQDDWCDAADKMGLDSMSKYLPRDLQWESLGAVLRGQVYVNTHCYTVPDLEAFVSHTNEFKFSIRAFHHAHQTYLVPEILKRAYGRPPASALFADNMYYKAEAYTASEQAGKILYENGLTPVYVSDNPVINAQHLVFEAAKAYKYGLPYHAALNGVTAAPAELLGLGERIGKVKEGFDADIVIWDSDPLSVGATPQQVWIDGAAQFETPYTYKKADAVTTVSHAISAEIAEETSEVTDIMFTGVSKLLLPDIGTSHEKVGGKFNVLVQDGLIKCVGTCGAFVKDTSVKVIDLGNGYIVPPFTAFGSFIGLSEIDAELSTQDGPNPDSVFSRAVDGLALDNKQLQAGYRRGVTRAITAPNTGRDDRRGVSVGFFTGAKEALEEGAVWSGEVAVHYPLTLSVRDGKTPSISSAVGSLRKALLKASESNDTNIDPYTEEAYLKRVVLGDLPLVLDAYSADTIAAALRVKKEVEAKSGASNSIHMVIYGGSEAHLVASELAAADVGVVLSPLQSYSESWDQRRSLTGAPLTNGTTLDVLSDAGVRTAIGVKENWEVRDLDLLAGIAYANSNGRLSEEDALKLVGENIYEMLGLDNKAMSRNEFIVYEGSPLEIKSQVRAISDGRGKISVHPSQ